MAMINSENIVGTKEIADVFNVSSSAVVNFQTRYSDFPVPIKKLESGPIFDLSEIRVWGIKHNRIPIRSTIPIEAGEHKSIALVGLPKTGKSYSSSIFVAENECFILRRTFSRSGDDFTQCAVKIIVSSKITEPYAQFNSDKEEVRQYSRIDEDSLMNFVAEVNSYLKYKRESGEEITPSEYIEMFMPPSQLAMDIMSESNLSYLIITDTPGVSESYELVQIAEAHLVMLVLTDSGGETARAGFKKIVEGIAPLVATGDACFLYNLKKPCDDENEYDDMQQDAEIAMQNFELEFAPLRKSIINTSMNILHPSKSVLGVPGMKDRKINFAEKIYRQKLAEVISRSFKGEGFELIINELNKSLTDEIRLAQQTPSEICNSLVDYITSVITQVPRMVSDLTKPDYFETFKSQKHARVKSQDGYRIVNAVSYMRSQSLNELYHSFSAYTVESTTNVLIQAGIKLFYRLISEELKNDSGLGIGVHPWEDYPPVTMRAIEYIFASELNCAVNQTTDGVESTYRNILINNGIVSKSWNCVRVDTNNLYFLNILTNCGVLTLHSTDLKELVRNRYIGGLRKIGEYKAWRECLVIFDQSISIKYSTDALIKVTGV